LLDPKRYLSKGKKEGMTAGLHIKGDLLNAPNYRRMARGLLSALLLSLTIHAGEVAAGENSIQTQESIREAVRAFITQGINKQYPHYEIKVSNLDPRLKLAACKIPLQGFLPVGGQLIGNTTIGVRCVGSNPWTIYVPAFVKAMIKVVITSHPILRHATISSDDIRLEERDVTSGSDSYIYNPEHVLGKVAKRALTTSTPLTPDMLNEPLLVRRGQQVIILAEGPGIQVRMAGTALMDGTEGQIIRAQNKLSKRTVEGQVIQPGIIKVNM
jgi:flagellar basal body P-ring formation protein FlgA